MTSFIDRRRIESVTYQPSPQLLADVDNRFTFHAVQGDQAARYQEIRDQARDLAKTILALTPPSREQSLALTKLQEVSMWANAAIACNEKPLDEKPADV